MITFLYRRVCTHRETDPARATPRSRCGAGCDRASITASAGSPRSLLGNSNSGVKIFHGCTKGPRERTLRLCGRSLDLPRPYASSF
jgi:hypothetical protein